VWGEFIDAERRIRGIVCGRPGFDEGVDPCAKLCGVIGRTTCAEAIEPEANNGIVCGRRNGTLTGVYECWIFSIYLKVTFVDASYMAVHPRILSKQSTLSRSIF